MADIHTPDFHRALADRAKRVDSKAERKSIFQLVDETLRSQKIREDHDKQVARALAEARPLPSTIEEFLMDGGVVYDRIRDARAALILTEPEAHLWLVDPDIQLLAMRKGQITATRAALDSCQNLMLKYMAACRHWVRMATERHWSYQIGQHRLCIAGCAAEELIHLYLTRWIAEEGTTTRQPPAGAGDPAVSAAPIVRGQSGLRTDLKLVK